MSDPKHSTAAISHLLPQNFLGTLSVQNCRDRVTRKFSGHSVQNVGGLIQIKSNRI